MRLERVRDGYYVIRGEGLIVRRRRRGDWYLIDSLLRTASRHRTKSDAARLAAAKSLWQSTSG